MTILNSPPPPCFVFGAAASSVGTEAIGGQSKGEGDKAGTGTLLGRKRARLMPAGSFDKVTPEAGEDRGRESPRGGARASLKLTLTLTQR